MTQPPHGRAALQTWASGLNVWWAWCKLWWALTWRYIGAAWLLLASLGFLALHEPLRYVVGFSGAIGLFFLFVWCGREVLHLSQPVSEEGSRFGDQRLLQPLDVRATAWVLLAALGLAVLSMLSLSDAGILSAGFPVGYLLFVGGVGKLFQNEVLQAVLILPLDALFFSESYLVRASIQALGLFLMFVVWSRGLMRQSIPSGSRTLVLLATLLVIFSVTWAALDHSEGTSLPGLYPRWIVSAIGLGIGGFGLWCRRRPAFWKALTLSWLVFAWVWAAPFALIK